MFNKNNIIKNLQNEIEILKKENKDLLFEKYKTFRSFGSISRVFYESNDIYKTLKDLDSYNYSYDRNSYNATYYNYPRVSVNAICESFFKSDKETLLTLISLKDERLALEIIKTLYIKAKNKEFKCNESIIEFIKDIEFCFLNNIFYYKGFKLEDFSFILHMI